MEELSETDELKARCLVLETCLLGLLDALDANAVAPVPVRSPEIKLAFLTAAHLRMARLAERSTDDIVFRAIEIYEAFAGGITIGLRR